MLIAQITDLHVEPGLEVKGNTIETVGRAVAHLNAFSPRPDLVIVTGDLVARERLDGEAEILFLMTGIRG
jgi:3',5'-cyclic AMP phosphodiesterase CpdA